MGDVLVDHAYDGSFGYDRRSWQFTGKERDAETGMDFFGARYFSAAQGRFTSPDLPLFDQHIQNPQSWNLYSYGRNNPLHFVDPTGMAVVGEDDDPKNCLCSGPNPKNKGPVMVSNEKMGGPLDMPIGMVKTIAGMMMYHPDPMQEDLVRLNTIGEKKGGMLVDVLSWLSVVGDGFKLLSGGHRIALGLRAFGLEEFASQMGAKLLTGSNWQHDFMFAMQESKTKAFFSLEGVDVQAGVARAASGRGGPTDWELLQIKSNPQWWDRIQFMKEGKPVENPFK